MELSWLPTGSSLPISLKWSCSNPTYRQLTSNKRLRILLLWVCLNRVDMHLSFAAVHYFFISCGSFCLSSNIFHWKLQVCCIYVSTYSCKQQYQFPIYAPVVVLVYLYSSSTLHFSDNGFLMMPSSVMIYNLTFTSVTNFSASDFQKQLLIRCNTLLTACVLPLRLFLPCI